MKRIAQIARDITAKGYLVSTVELIDGTYETMVFAPHRNIKRIFANPYSKDWWDMRDVHCERTRQPSEANLNHTAAIKLFD